MALKRSQENIARSEERKARNANEVVREPNQVDATQLSQPVSRVTVPQPIVSTIPERVGATVGNVVRDVNGFITAQTEDAKRLKELQSTYGSLADQGSLSDIFKQTTEEFGGGSESVKELKDISLQLNDLDTGSKLRETAIQGAAGQTIGQAGREVTQEQRENAVRSSGLAARAAVLQGNIQTANALAKDAVDIAFKDRQDKATNLINQITMVQKTVDEQTSQLLELDKRQFEAELSRIEELKSNIANAMVNGASQAEISQLNDANMPDDQRLALAQQITARGANQMRDLDIQSKVASINASNTSTALNQRKLDDLDKAVEEGKLTVEQMEVANALRSERNNLQEVKDAKDLEGSFVGLISALQQGDGIGDISAINSFQRLAVDPGVAVREGDVALLQSAQSWVDQAWLRAQGLMEGDKLTPEARIQMQNLASKIYDARVGFVEDNTAQIRTVAQESGIDYNKYVGKEFVSSNVLINKMSPIEFEEVTPTDSGIQFPDGASFTLPNN